jgi:hypothetical protein
VQSKMDDARRSKLLELVKQAAPIPDAAVKSLKDRAIDFVFGRPVRSVGNGVKDFLLGRAGAPHTIGGGRKIPVKGLGGLSEISKREFNMLSKEIADNPSRGVVEIIRDGNGNKIYAKRKLTHGGLVGAVQRNPVAAGAAGLLAYGASRPDTGPIVYSLVPGAEIKERQSQMANYNQPNYANNGPWG